MAKALPKINDVNKTPMKDVLDDGAPKKRRGRPKKLQTLEEVKADIDARNPTYVSPVTGGKLPVKKTRAKISPAKFYALDAGLKLEEENKVQTEKITKLITIQKLHRTNHQKEKAEIGEINNVLTGIVDFIKADYESRVDAADQENNQIREDAAKEDQKQKEKGSTPTEQKRTN